MTNATHSMNAVDGTKKETFFQIFSKRRFLFMLQKFVWAWLFERHVHNDIEKPSQRRLGYIIYAKTGPKPLDLTTTESALVSIIMHFRVAQRGVTSINYRSEESASPQFMVRWACQKPLSECLEGKKEYLQGISPLWDVPAFPLYLDRLR
jgi:hypothetical protein